MSYNMTIPTSLNPITSLIQNYIPTSLHPFLLLSYPIQHSKASPTTFFRHTPTSRHNGILYDKGYKDIYFTISCAIIFTLLRSICMRFIFSPFADFVITRNRNLELQARQKQKLKFNGNGNGNGHGDISPSKLSRSSIGERETKKELKKRQHIITRFSEQAWSWLYCSVFWTLGMFTLYSVPSPTSPESLWATYPFIHLPALTKFYYLAQLGWWFHQIYVINTEKRRKDHWQMFGHHILTITLIVTSYIANFTRIGIVIHVLMDFCDIFLPLAKMLRYLSYTQSCDITFVIFLISWLFSREIGLFLVIKTILNDAPKFIKYQWAPAQGRYFTLKTHFSFLALITLLWILASIWFYMACVVAIRVVRGQGAEDSRSDDEDEDEDDQEEDEVNVVDDEDIRDKEILDDVPQSVGTATDHLNDPPIKSNGHSNGHQYQNGGGLKKRK